MPNRLAASASPYLLQHKDNPVDWYEWGPEALERLVDPMVAGIHACSPEEISLRAAFPDLARAVERHGTLFAALRGEGGRG